MTRTPYELLTSASRPVFPTCTNFNFDSCK